MLRITQQTSAEAARSYYATADYYTEGRETVGRWGGEGARRLGLEGDVGQREFELLCENRDPRGGGKLTPRRKEERTVGYDFTWSVPKSVSLLYALTGDAALLEAFRESVDETMRDIEAEMKARVRSDGQNAERVTGNMAWAEFVHYTSRPVEGVPDPQLHAHCFVFNATFDGEEDRWKAGQFRDLKRDAPYWQAAFRARLANRLQERGYALERKRDDFEIAGVPAAVLKRFSRRTEVIEDLARELGIEDPEAKAKLGAASRNRKNKNLSWEELTQEWLGRLAPAERQALTEAAAARQVPTRPEGMDARSVDFAVRHVFAKEAVVAEKRLLAEALKHGLGAVTVEGVRREYDRLPLLVEERDGRRMVTTAQVLAEEDRLVEFARSGRGTRQPLGLPGRPFQREWLNPGQRKAVEHILAVRDQVILIRGAAGTGKTTLMQEAVEAIREGGHDVVVLAPSSTASRDVLRGEGFQDADTVAMFFKSQELQQRAAGQVIWVDEAGLLGSQDMAALFEHAGKLNARVVLMGDRQQHASPSRGSPLKLLEEEAGVPAIAVTDILRQGGDNKKAVQWLSEGETARGFAELDRLGWVKEVSGGPRYLQLAEAYLKACAEKKADGKEKTALVVSPTHAEADRITATIRKALAAQGKLKGERELAVWVPAHLTEAERGEASRYAAGDMLQFHQNAKGYRSGTRVIAAGQPLPLDQAAKFQVYRPALLQLAAGDRLRVTANGKTADGKHRLNNGALLTVRGFTPEGNVVVDNGWEIGKDFGHLAHGYVVTSHASQGKTVDKVMIGQSSVSLPASGREQFYVSVSRAREQALIFTDDKQALLESVQRGGERLTATELVRGKKPGCERLKKHLAFLRRRDTFARIQEGPAADRAHAVGRDREVSYAR